MITGVTGGGGGGAGAGVGGAAAGYVCGVGYLFQFGGSALPDLTQSAQDLYTKVPPGTFVASCGMSRLSIEGGKFPVMTVPVPETTSDTPPPGVRMDSFPSPMGILIAVERPQLMTSRSLPISLPSMTLAFNVPPCRNLGVIWGGGCPPLPTVSRRGSSYLFITNKDTTSLAGQVGWWHENCVIARALY